MAQTIVTLSDFPEAVVCYVTDTRTGIQANQDFPPSVREIRKACIERMAWLDSQAKAAEFQARKAESDRLKSMPRAKEVLPEGRISYDEFLKREEAKGNKNPRPLGFFENKMPA